MPNDSTNSNQGSGTGNSEPTKNGMADYVPYFGNNNNGQNTKNMMQVQPAQGPPYNNYDGLPRNGFVGATITPSDSTVVSELTEDIRTIDVINPPGLKQLTTSNIARMENGESDYTPKTDAWDAHDDPDKDKDVKVTAWNAEGLNALKNSKKHRSKMIIFGLLFLLIVIAAVALGIGLSQNSNRGNDSNESQLPGGGGGNNPTIAPGIPTLAPATLPPGETASPTDVGETISPTSSSSGLLPPSQAPVGLGETAAPTAESTEEGTDEVTTAPPVDVPTEAPITPPIETPVVPPTDAPVVPPTDAPVDPPTDAPISSPTSDCTDTVEADKACYAPTDEILVTYSVCNPDPTGGDWIGMYRNPANLDPDNLGDNARYWETICNGNWCRGPDPYVNSMVLGLSLSEVVEGTYGLYLIEGPDDAAPYKSFAQTTIEISTNCR